MSAEIVENSLLSRGSWVGASSWRGVVVALVAMAFVALFVPAPGLAAFDDLPNRWVQSPVVATDGEVNVIARHPGTGRIIIGGKFNQVCQPDRFCKPVRNLAVLSAPDRIATNADLANPPPEVNGDVYALAITGSLEWQPGSPGTPPVVWVGGRFDEVSRGAHNGLFGFDLSTGRIVDARPLAHARSAVRGRGELLIVNALAVGPERLTADRKKEQTLYIGGSFKVTPRVCGDSLFEQENLASFTVRTDQDQVDGTYNHRWAARPRSPVTSLAVVPSGPWEGLLVAAANGVDYGFQAMNRFGRGPVALLTGTTGAPHSWQPKIAPRSTSALAGVGHMVFDEVLAETRFGGFALDISGHFAVSAGQNNPPVPNGRLMFSRLDIGGDVSRFFGEPGGGSVVPGALALAGRVRFQDGSAQRRWLIRATNRGLDVMDAVTGERSSTIRLSNLGQEAVRSVLAVPGFGVMVAGKFADNMRLFRWPSGNGGQRVRPSPSSRVRKGRSWARGRSTGHNRKAPVQVFGRRVEAIEPYPGGVAIGGSIDRLCPAGHPETSQACSAVGGIVGLEPDADSIV